MIHDKNGSFHIISEVIYLYINSILAIKEIKLKIDKLNN